MRGFRTKKGVFCATPGVFLEKSENFMRFLQKNIWRFQISSYLCNPKRKNAEVAQLVEHNLAKVGVASSSLVFRSKNNKTGCLRTALILVRADGSSKYT